MTAWCNMTEEARARHGERVLEQHHLRRTAFFRGKKCVDCGSKRDLELDHVRGTKVSSTCWLWEAGRQAREIAKCEIRCHPCHRRRHSLLVRRPHGTAGRYGRGCRCRLCKGANTARHRAWREMQVA